MFKPPSAPVAVTTDPGPTTALDCSARLHDAGLALERFIAAGLGSLGLGGMEDLAPAPSVAPADLNRWGCEAVGSVRALVRAYDLWTRQIHSGLTVASGAQRFDADAPVLVVRPSLTTAAAHLPARIAAALSAAWTLPLPLTDTAARRWQQSWTDYVALVRVGAATPRIGESGELRVSYDALLAERKLVADQPSWTRMRARAVVATALPHFAPAGDLARALTALQSGVGAKVQTLVELPRDAQLIARTAIVRALQWSWALLRYCMRITAALLTPLFEILH